MRTTNDNNDITRDIYSVSRLNREVRAVLEGSFPMIWIQGEISNLARPSSGHLYFSLKDQGSQVRCAMFKGRNRLLKFAPENGQEVLARASVSLYEGRGEFQLVVEQMEPAGEGALQRAFEELKQRLHGEGLFSDEIKRPLPEFPARIGIVTSPTGAAIRDILNVLQRRYPLAGVIIFPVKVQGEGSAEEIIEALELAQQRAETDLLILARGGGSLEDLWSFNDERVARAIHQCAIPVVTGIGHEIDFTIADFVADQRAPTPSAAAELAVPDARKMVQHVEACRARIVTVLRHDMDTASRHLAQLEKRIPDPVRFIQNIGQRVDDISLHIIHLTNAFLAARQNSLIKLSSRFNYCNPVQSIRISRERHRSLAIRLGRHINNLLREKRDNLNYRMQALNTISPLATLDRGYAIVTHKNTIVREARSVKAGELIRSRVSKGSIYSKVTRTNDD